MSAAGLTSRQPALPPAIVGRFPCTQSQQRFWILEQIAPGNGSANVALCWELRGSFQADSIETAYRRVVARHEILRTRFIEEDGLPIQEVVDHCDFKLSVIDLRTVPAEQLAARIAEISASEASTPFDLSRAGLIRSTLLQLSADRAYLLTTVHHMCFDGSSIRVLGREIGEIASALDAGRAPKLPELPLQYGDFSLWQQAFLASSGFETERHYWRQKLSGARYFEVPSDVPRGPDRTHAGAIVSRLLAKPVSDRIDAFARQECVSVFSLSAAILSAVLHRWTGQSDVSIGTQVASRDDIALEELIGVFINNIVLRFELSAETSFRDSLKAASATVQEALLYQRMPFNTLVEMLNPPRDLVRTPLISVNMIVQRAFMEDHRYEGFEILGRPSSTPGTLFDLNFMMIGRPEGWRTSLEYNPHLFHATTAEALLADWCEAIEMLTGTPAMRVGDLPAADRRGETIDAVPASVLESWTQSHPAVGAARALEAGNGRRRMLVVPAPGFHGLLEDLPGELRTYLASRLPSAALPDAINIVMQFPGGSASLPAPVGEPSDSSRLAAMEAEVSTLWQDLLGLEAIERTVNFFDIGGHSLLAVRLVARLRERLKIEVNTTILYQAPTIAGLARKLVACRSLQQSSPSSDDNRINEINPDAAGIPIISINNYSTIYAISKHFASPRRCITVRLVDPDVPFAREPQSFEAIADAYVELVRRAQPHGPYALFGVCVHGNLALEIARRLKAQGEDVVNVFVKDVWSPAYSKHVRDNRLIRRLNKWHDLRVRVRKWRRGELSLFDLLRYYPRLRSSRLLGRLETLAGSGLSLETRLLATTSQGAFIQYLSAARNRYTPQPYPGDMVMFRTREAPAGHRFDPTLGWKHIVEGTLEIEELDEILVFRSQEIGTGAVAAKMDAVLRAAEKAQPS